MRSIRSRLRRRLVEFDLLVRGDSIKAGGIEALDAGTPRRRGASIMAHVEALICKANVIAAHVADVVNLLHSRVHDRHELTPVHRHGEQFSARLRAHEHDLCKHGLLDERWRELQNTRRLFIGVALGRGRPLVGRWCLIDARLLGCWGLTVGPGPVVIPVVPHQKLSNAEKTDAVRSVMQGELKQLWLKLTKSAAELKAAEAAATAAASSGSPILGSAAADTSPVEPTINATLDDSSDGLLGRASQRSERELGKALYYSIKGHLSKACACLTQSPIAETADERVRRDLQGKHPVRELPAPRAVQQCERFETSMEEFDRVFKHVPRARAAGLIGLSFENYQAIYENGGRDVLFSLVSAINAGEMHQSFIDMLGEARIIALEKPDKGIRPIAIGDSLARLAAKCACQTCSAAFAAHLTTSRESPSAPAPLQLGVGVRGGTELVVHIARLLLEANPTWACSSNDIANGFNTVKRDAVYDALERSPFAYLLPMVQQYYSRRGGLFTTSGPLRGTVPAEFAESDEAADQELFDAVQRALQSLDFERAQPLVGSTHGVRQGDPLGPALFALAYHSVLVKLQAEFPDCVVIAYLDDTYVLGPPARAWAATLRLHDLAREQCSLEPNLGKIEVFAPDPLADLGFLPASVKGSPHHSNPEFRCLRGFKCVGAYVGDDDWAALQLSRRLERLKELLAKIGKLHDTDKIAVALQVQLNLLKHCANTVPNYWLRTMPPQVVAAAAAEHDQRIATAFAVATDFDTGDTCGTNALSQATLPTRMGGFGLSSMAAIAPAAFTASLAANLATIVSAVPSLAHITAHAAPTADRPLLPTIAALQKAHGELLTAHAEVHRVHAKWDLNPVGHDLKGDALFRFHPEGLPLADELPPLSDFHIPRSSSSRPGETSPTDLFDRAQRPLSQVVHHQRWLELRDSLAAVSRRELVRFISVSQPFAGAVLNAVPSQRDFRVATLHLQIMTQRRLGLPLTILRGFESSDFDCWGDSLSAGHDHTRRHNEVARVLSKACRQALNKTVLVDTLQHEHFSPGARPDVCVLRGALDKQHQLLLEVKVASPVSSNPELTSTDGAYSSFANTAPDLLRGIMGCPAVGGRAAVPAKYQGAFEKGNTVVPCIFETFGGFEGGVVDLLNNLSKAARAKTPPGQEPPWSARHFVPYWSQLLSREVQLGVADEIIARVHEKAAEIEAGNGRGA